MVVRTSDFMGWRTRLLASEIDADPFALRTDFGVAAIDGASDILSASAGPALGILKGGSWV
jgi:hypothetical protein